VTSVTHSWRCTGTAWLEKYVKLKDLRLDILIADLPRIAGL
jgi:hypothetical protein